MLRLFLTSVYESSYRREREAIARGNAKTLPTPRALADHVSEIFDEAIRTNTKADSQE